MMLRLGGAADAWPTVAYAPISEGVINQVLISVLWRDGYIGTIGPFHAAAARLLIADWNRYRDPDSPIASLILVPQ